MSRVREIVLRSLASSVVAAALCGWAGQARAEPVRVTGRVEIDSAGGDFPGYQLPVNELLYQLGGPGLPKASGEAYESIPALGTTGGLVVERQATPSPLVAGQIVDLSTRATFLRGRAFEEGWPETGRVYDIAGDFRFIAGRAALREAGLGELIATAPFRFVGSLSAFDVDSGALLFSRDLVGRGSARVAFFPPNPPFFDYRYTLAPVPEPATLTLVGGGIGLALASRRRRRHATS